MNNTLFLGTITHSEGINKIFVHVEILDGKGEIVAGGEYTQINLEVMEREKAEAMELKKEMPYKGDKMGYSEYGFLRMGRDFKKVQDVLERLDHVFLPQWCDWAARTLYHAGKYPPQHQTLQRATETNRQGRSKIIYLHPRKQSLPIVWKEKDKRTTPKTLVYSE